MEELNRVNKQLERKKGNSKEVKLPDEPFDKVECRKKQRAFLQFTLNQDWRLKYTRKKRTIAYVTDDDVKLPVKVEEQLVDKRLILYPEAIPYLFNLEGCPKKLFLFLLLYRENRNDRFIFNSSVISLFHQFCEMHPPVYGDDSVKQAMKHLRSENIILNLKRGENMINPMITGGKSDGERLRLIGEYSHELLQQGKNTLKDFYAK